MTIYIVSGAGKSGRSTLAARLVGKRNVYDLGEVIRQNPLDFPKKLRALLESRNAHESRIAIDGVTSPDELDMIWNLAKVGEDVIHYHVANPDGGRVGCSQGMLECACRAEYRIEWSGRPPVSPR